MTLEEASNEVGTICNASKNDDIDLTILLTHIGFDLDVQLARLLKPEWGVDMIIRGHSHTVLDKPALENNVLITQTGVGTDQIGRFDVVVDDDTNSIVDCNWQLIPIDEKLVPPNLKLGRYISSFQEAIDRKYNSIICKLSQKYTHPKREIENSLGNLIADSFGETAECAVMLIGSGSIRINEIGPLVTLKDLSACFPYDDTLTRYTVEGEKLKRIFAHIMHPDNRKGEGECYQVNGKIRATYNDTRKQLVTQNRQSRSTKYCTIQNLYSRLLLQEFRG
ncbi:MAG: 5-nucleotidase / UDP-sugar diphosphatase [Thermoproteota archaeon]|nr:5-nucleotidase / UDP-sugar diphosphatase [Thermoproteota archaeon]